MPRRVQISLADGTSGYTFAINPINFDGNDNPEFSISSTIDGYSVIMKPIFDGNPRAMEWNNLPNKAPYSLLVSSLRTYINKRCRLYLQDLYGNQTYTGYQYIYPLSIETKWGVGSSSSDSSLKYETVKFTYVPTR
jgi:hypothetical protein